MCKFASETYKQLIMDAQKTKEQALEFIKNAVKHKQEWKKELETEFKGKDVNVVFL